MIWIYIAQFLATAVLLWFFKPFACRVGLFDLPNERSSHSVATPRGAGIAFVFVWMLGSALMAWFDPDHLHIYLSIVGMGFFISSIGFLDDLYGISSSIRLLVHIAAALGFLVLNYEILPHFWSSIGILFLIVSIVWSVNLFNFMDGIDGLAVIESIIVLGIGGFFSLWFGAYLVTSLCFGLVACLGGFLFFNFPKAKLFMGDVGSGFLGFIIACLIIVSYFYYQMPIWIWLIAYSIFITDATITLLHRCINREKWYSAHRKHAYQRLHHLADWSHLKINMFILSLNLSLGLIIWLMFADVLSLMTGCMTAIAINVFYVWLSEMRAPFIKST